MRKFLVLLLLCVSARARAVQPEAILVVLGFDFFHNAIRAAVGSNDNKVIAFMKGGMVGTCEFSMKLAAATTPREELMPAIKAIHSFCASIGDNIQFNRTTFERLSFNLGVGSLKFDHWKPFLSINIPAILVAGAYENAGYRIDWKKSLLYTTPVLQGEYNSKLPWVGLYTSNIIVLATAPVYNASAMKHEYTHLLGTDEGRWMEELFYTKSNKDLLEHFDFYPQVYPVVMYGTGMILSGKLVPDRTRFYREVEAETFQMIHNRYQYEQYFN